MANTLQYNNQTFSVGDTIRVSQKIKEGDKTRIQVFEGVLIGIKGSGTGQSFRVRKIGHSAIGIERIWPVQSPAIQKITLKKRGSARRAKLYYLRQRVGKQALLTKAATEKPSLKPKIKSKVKSPPKAAKPAAQKPAIKKTTPSQAKKQTK